MSLYSLSSGILPVEMCVLTYTSGCDMYTRAGMDASLNNACLLCFSGILPVEMCVLTYTSGCDMYTRAAMDTSLTDLLTAAASTCKMPEKMSPQLLKYEEG